MRWPWPADHGLVHMNNNLLPAYTVRAANPPPGLGDGWSHPAWARADTAAVNHFRPESSAHRPPTLVRLLHGGGGIRGVFHVDDQYRSEEHTSELQSLRHLVCRLL